MSKEFEKWLNDPEGDWYGTHEYGTAGQCAADAWHYQQKKIDELEAWKAEVLLHIPSAGNEKYSMPQRIKELEEIEKAGIETWRQLSKANKRIEILEHDVSKLIEMGRFYGDKKNWNCQLCNVLSKPIAYIPRIDTEEDEDGNAIYGGKRARETLEELRGNYE